MAALVFRWLRPADFIPSQRKTKKEKCFIASFMASYKNPVDS